MKVLKIVLAVVLGVVLVAFIGFYIFIKTFDISKQLPTISKQASDLIKRQVSITKGSLDLSLIQGFSLNLGDVKISDDPSFNKGDFLSIAQISIGLKLLPLLTKQQVHITKVIVSSPKITIIRSAQGTLNTQSMTPASAASTPASISDVTSNKQASSSQTQTVPLIMVNSFIIEHGEVTIEDAAAQFPMKLNVSGINAKINNFSSVEPFDFKISMNLLAKGKSNIDISGRCRLDVSKSGLRINLLKISSDLGNIDLEALKRISPVLEGLPVWPLDLKGDLLISAGEFTASASGLENFSLDILISNASIRLKELAVPFNRISIKVNTDLKVLTIKPFEAYLATGLISGEGRIEDLLSMPRLDFQLQTKDIKLDETLDQSAWPVLLKGALNSHFSVKTSSFDPVLMLKNLNSDGQLSLKEAKIEKLNLLKMLLTKLSFIPGLEGALNASLPENIRKRLNTETTLLDTVETKIHIQDETIHINNALLESKGLFALTANGKAGFNLATNMTVVASLSNEISSPLVSSVSLLSGLLDNEGRVSIPGTVSGEGGRFMYTPQVGDLAKKALISEGASQLERVLDKNPEVKNILNSILGGGDTSSETSQTADQSKKEESSSKDLINGVFNRFLK